MGLFDSIGSQLSGIASNAASAISAAASNVSNAVSSAFGGGSSSSSGNSPKSDNPSSGSPTPSSTPTPSSDKSTSSSKSYTYTSPTTGKTSTTTDYRHSDAAKAADAANRSVSSSSPPSSNDPLTKTSETVTVQPVFISAGKGGVSYDITYADGTQNGIAVSGISLSESVDYYLRKSAEAEARGDTEKAAKYAKNARDFAAAANYEAASGIMSEYGKSTGISYDATAATRLNESTWQSYVDPAAVVQYDKSYNLTPATSYYAPMTVSTKLGEAPTPANTTTLTGSGNNTSLSEPLRYQWDDSKGVFENLIEGTAYNFNKTFAEPFQAGGIGGVISNAPIAAGAAWAEAGQTVDNYILWSDQASASDDPLQKTLGVVNTILSPVDAIRVGKLITDGRAGEITGENGAWALLDVATLVPVVGWAAKAAALGKLGKLSKLTKAADGLTDAAKAGDAAEDAAKIGKKSDDISTALQPADSAKLEKDIAKLEKTTKATNAVGTMGTFGQIGLLGVTAASDFINELLTDDGDDGNKDGIIDQNEKPQKLWEDNPYHWEYNPGEQRPYSEQDISDILSAALAGLSGNQTAGGAGGGGDITIVNETPAASSSASDWFEQVKPYIIPALIAIVIIALIALSGKDGKKTKSKGARA